MAEPAPRITNTVIRRPAELLLWALGVVVAARGGLPRCGLRRTRHRKGARREMKLAVNVDAGCPVTRGVGLEQEGSVSADDVPVTHSDRGHPGLERESLRDAQRRGRRDDDRALAAVEVGGEVVVVGDEPVRAPVHPRPVGAVAHSLVVRRAGASVVQAPVAHEARARFHGLAVHRVASLAETDVVMPFDLGRGQAGPDTPRPRRWCRSRCCPRPRTRSRSGSGSGRRRR